MFEKEAEEYRLIFKSEEELTETKELIEKYQQAVDKCLHITFMGGGYECKN